MKEGLCPECGSARTDFSRVCPACGAPPESEQRQVDGTGEDVRTTDLEPYIALSYIAKLFKVLAALIVFMLVGEVVTGLLIDGQAAVMTLLGEATRLLVMAGLLWAGGDITLLMIDVGHDLRVARILLGRINARVHREESEAATSALGNAAPAPAPPATRS